VSFITDLTILSESKPDHFLAHVAKFTYRYGQRTASMAESMPSKIDMESASGNKVYCGHVYAGAYNYFPVQDFVAHLRTWDMPHQFMRYGLIVTLHTEGDAFTLWRGYAPDLDEHTFDAGGWAEDNVVVPGLPRVVGESEPVR
jgi:hypothetical protein